jgi:hypothetical protein
MNTFCIGHSNKAAWSRERDGQEDDASSSGDCGHHHLPEERELWAKDCHHAFCLSGWHGVRDAERSAEEAPCTCTKEMEA